VLDGDLAILEPFLKIFVNVNDALLMTRDRFKAVKLLVTSSSSRRR
jgi:hypothetical protein